MQIEPIRQKIKTASTTAVRALHKFIFEEDGDRGNRQWLREFQGFKFREGAAEYVNKLEYVRRLTIGDLISCCNLLGLEYDGNKEELIARMCKSLIDLNSLVPVLNPEDVEEENEEVDEINEEENGGKDEESDEEIRSESGSQSRAPMSSRINMKFTMNYKDVEASIRQFNSKDAYPVERWIADFEETAVLFKWTALQRVIFAKRSLTELAKMLIESEGVIKTWQKLKTVLEDEFADKISSAQLHKMLAKRKMKKEETVQEYYFVMKELASRGKIEQESLIQYVIDGIQDDTNNKLVLYGTKKIEDFKEKLKVYETINKKNSEKTKSNKDESTKKKEMWKKTTAAKKTESKEPEAEIRCYNCGIKGHKSKECKNKELGKKCFRCQKFGHTANQCSSTEESKVDKKQSVVNTIASSFSNKMLKEVTVDDTRFNALVDTGSQVTIINEDVYHKIKPRQLLDITIYLTGFGKNEVKSLGCFQTILKIDHKEFPCTMHVVPTEAMNNSIIIGNDVLSMAEVIINADGITLCKTTSSIFLDKLLGLICRR